VILGRRTKRAVAVRSAIAALALAWVGAGLAGRAVADVASDHPAAILVFPKLLVDTANGLDTLVRITNVADTPINVKCFYVNATPKCSLDQATSCFPNRNACFRDVNGTLVPGMCLPQWQETDFVIRLTRDQPTGWLVSAGESVNCAFIDGVCSNDGTTRCDKDTDCGAGNHCVKPPCFPLDGGPLGRTGPGGDTNGQSAVPLAPQDPFIGELKCIAFDESGEKPVARNDLIGDVLLGRVQAGPDQTIELAGYNAIGIPAILDVCVNGTCSVTGGNCQTDTQCIGTNNRDNTLVLGGPPDRAEYEGCPNILILDHYFDGAADPLITNICKPDGTCSVSGTACTNDNDCIDNICLMTGTCSVTGTACTTAADCENTCILTNTCTGTTCSATGATCTTNADCPRSVCSLSGDRCLRDADCPTPSFLARVGTDLTLVPCTEDFENQRPLSTTVQFLVFNEFEQRYSTSAPVTCFKEVRLSNLETPQNQNSIFSVGTSGTLTGQTRIRGVVDTNNPQAGNALLGVAEEFRCIGPKYQFPLCNFVDQTDRMVGAAAKNLHFQGRRPQSDFIYLP
jgi:hypothetical protein